MVMVAISARASCAITLVRHDAARLGRCQPELVHDGRRAYAVVEHVAIDEREATRTPDAQEEGPRPRSNGAAGQYPRWASNASRRIMHAELTSGISRNKSCAANRSVDPRIAPRGHGCFLEVGLLLFTNSRMLPKRDDSSESDGASARGDRRRESLEGSVDGIRRSSSSKKWSNGARANATPPLRTAPGSPPEGVVR